jgi:hypothetical protein
VKALLIIVALAACHRPGPKRFGGQLVAIKDRIARAVKLDVKAKVDLKALATPPPSTAPPAQQRVQEPPPASTPPTTAPPPTTSNDPPMQVTRVDASKPTVFVLRGQSHDGKSFCADYTTLQECNTSCTDMLRANALKKPEPSSAKSCSCTELDRGC